MQDSHRETSLSQLSNDMMNMNKSQEYWKIPFNMNYWCRTMVKSHWRRNETESGNWLNQRKHRILCALVSYGNFTELNFTDWQIKKLSWVSETEWLNQYHSMLLSNSPRTLLVEPASTSVRDMTGLAPPRVFSLQNKKRSIIVSCHFVSVCSFSKNLFSKEVGWHWIHVLFVNPRVPFCGQRIF